MIAELENFFINDITEYAIFEQSNCLDLQNKVKLGVDLKNIFNNVIIYDKLLNLISGKNENFYFLYLNKQQFQIFFNIENFENQNKSTQTLDYLIKKIEFKK